ncbi:MAG: hypothetical protein U0835_23690 [Isosphaeraceae bacterium]
MADLLITLGTIVAIVALIAFVGCSTYFVLTRLSRVFSRVWPTPPPSPHEQPLWLWLDENSRYRRLRAGGSVKAGSGPTTGLGGVKIAVVEGDEIAREVYQRAFELSRPVGRVSRVETVEGTFVMRDDGRYLAVWDATVLHLLDLERDLSLVLQKPEGRRILGAFFEDGALKVESYSERPRSLQTCAIPTDGNADLSAPPDWSGEARNPYRT